jgi:hypothetical protein
MTALCSTKVDEIFGLSKTLKHYSIPLYSCSIAAGFPSPADEFLEGKLDLNQYLIHQPLATYFVRVSGESMHPVKSLEQLKEAVATHATTAAAKLRKQKQCTTAITVFILTSRFKDNYYSNSITLPLPVATNRTPELIHAALRGLEVIYRQGYEYKKAGIIMQGLQPECLQQGNVFLQNYEPDKQQKLMETVDRLNTTMGRNTLYWAASGVNQSWTTRKDNVSPRYTTNWDELPIVKASFFS